jgi:hypothetical protein
VEHRISALGFCILNIFLKKSVESTPEKVYFSAICIDSKLFHWKAPPIRKTKDEQSKSQMFLYDCFDKSISAINKSSCVSISKEDFVSIRNG